MKQAIGIFDSGIGGISLLNQLKQKQPAIPIKYFADTRYNPYGKLTPDQVISRSFTISDHLINQDCSTILIACNTVTTLAINKLRQHHPDINFVGIEPGINPAIKATKTNNIAILATPNTLNSPSLKSLEEKYSDAQFTFIHEPCPGLVEAVESMASTQKLASIITKILEPIKKRGVDTITLSSTHFSLIHSVFKESTDLTIINPINAVARQVLKVHKSNNSYSEVTYTTSGDLDLFNKQLHHYLRPKSKEITTTVSQV